MSLENTRSREQCDRRRSSSSRASLSSVAGSWSLRPEADDNGMRNEQWKPEEGPHKLACEVGHDMIAGAGHRDIVLLVPEMENWKTYQGYHLRKFVAGLTVKTKGPVDVVTGHARLARHFGSTQRARAPVLTVLPRVQDRDKDFLRGDDTVDGVQGSRRFFEYKAGKRRGPYRLRAFSWSRYIRVHACAARVRRQNDGTCAVVFSFKLGPGAEVRIDKITLAIYASA